MFVHMLESRPAGWSGGRPVRWGAPNRTRKQPAMITATSTGLQSGTRLGFSLWRSPRQPMRKTMTTAMIAASNGLVGRHRMSTTAATAVQIARARGTCGCSTMHRPPHHVANPEAISRPLELTTAIRKSTIGDKAMRTPTRGMRRG